LLERACHLAQPPLPLLGAGMACLQVLVKRNVNAGVKIVWETLYSSNLLPHPTAGGDLNTGLLGSLLAQQEVPSGEYPLTESFLDLVLVYIDHEKDINGQSLEASLGYTSRELFPSYHQWRFADPIGKEVFGKKVLAIFTAFLGKKGNEQASTRRLRQTVVDILLQPAPIQVGYNHDYF